MFVDLLVVTGGEENRDETIFVVVVVVEVFLRYVRLGFVILSFLGVVDVVVDEVFVAALHELEGVAEDT